ncbi:MAG: rRNA maturation RNase YbeY [bacterium]
MKILITNTQKSFGLDIGRITRFLSRMAENLQKADPGTKWSEVSLVLTDTPGIRRINMRFLDSPDTTDVISFRYLPIPGDDAPASGEVFVNVEQAVESKAARGNCSRELALYIAHGCDHLSGEDDATAAGYARMRRRELRWLRTAAAAGLLRKPLITGARRTRKGSR